MRRKGLGFERFKKFAARLNSPQNNYKIIHVAGTNGKGSVAYLLAKALQENGYKTGLFISPHVTAPTERIQVNGKPISKKTFVRLFEEIDALSIGKLNFFEMLTAMALVYFARKKVQYAVLETGLGGRIDPTNICVPVLSVITSVGLDHTGLLGTTLAQIAREKAGIIKPNTPVVCGSLPAAAKREIVRVSRTANAPLYFAPKPFEVRRINWTRGTMQIKNPDGKKAFALHLIGPAQAQNAAVVLQAGQLLNLKKSAVKKAFARVQVPVRWEIIRTPKNTFILDGAHNPQAVDNFIKMWRACPFYPRATLVCGFMCDKDYPAMARKLAAHFEHVIFTQPPSPRAVSAALLKPYGPNAEIVPDWRVALRRACAQSTCVVCTGSFYLAGAVRGLVHKRATSR